MNAKKIRRESVRQMIAREVARRHLSRSLTQYERDWAKDGWVPATLATPEVRE